MRRTVVYQSFRQAREVTDPTSHGSLSIEDERQALFKNDDQHEATVPNQAADNYIAGSSAADRFDNNIKNTFGLRETAKLSFEFCILWVR